MAENRIVIGNDVYTDTDIRNGNVYLSSSLAADELSIDTLDVTADVTSLVPTIFQPKDYDRMYTSENEVFGVRPYFTIATRFQVDYQYGQSVKYYHGNNLVGTFYLSSVKRTGTYTYALSCFSVIGLLDGADHYGGIYSGTTKVDTLESVAKDIVGSGIECVVDSDIRSIRIIGYLPISTRRENLHQLLFATGTTVTTGERNGKPAVFIKALKETSAKAIPPSDIYIGGSVEMEQQISRVVVHEHSYVATSGEKTTLYEGSVISSNITTPKGSILNGTIITFSAPMHSLSAVGSTILESGENYAVLSPSAGCQLTGIEYTHTTRQIIRNIENARAVVNIRDNDAVVEEATLVNPLNSENVADRVAYYYTSAKTVNVDLIKSGSDLPGDRISFDDAFGDHTTGYIKSMDITMSGKLKASSEVVEGYSPVGLGNNYNNVLVITKSTDEWYAPADKGIVISIGGGNGGRSGSNGEDGTGGLKAQGNDGENGNGGAGGSSGSGGKINIKTVTFERGIAYNIQIGRGGSGCYDNSEESIKNSIGGETRLGRVCSSEDGQSYETGYKNIFDGLIYATPGKNGIDGSKAGDTLDVDGRISYSGKRGKSVTSGNSYAYGGYGGGPSYGTNGQDGWDGNIQSGFSNGGAGGDGANGNYGSSAVFYGCGGNGGNGGGGGGGGGGAHYATDTEFTQKSETGEGGKGGLGGRGGDGADGCIIIYY